MNRSTAAVTSATARLFVLLTLTGMGIPQPLHASDNNTSTSEVRRILQQAIQIADSLPDGSLKTAFMRDYRRVAEASEAVEKGGESAARTARNLRSIEEIYRSQERMLRLAPTPLRPQDTNVQEQAEAKLKAGDLGGALQTVTAIQDENSRGMAVRNLALCAAQGGDLKGAVQLAESLGAKSILVKDCTLAEVAAIQAQSGDVAAALRIIKGLAEDRADSSFTKAEALTIIATVLAEGGDREGASGVARDAIRVLEATRHDLGSFAAIRLSSVAIAQAKAGDRAAAVESFRKSLKVASAMPKEGGDYGPYSKAWALWVIAGVQARHGNTKEALHALAAVRAVPPPPRPLNEYTRGYECLPAETVRAIAKGMAENGNTAGALDWGSKLTESGEKAYALLGVAEGMLARISRETD